MIPQNQKGQRRRVPQASSSQVKGNPRVGSRVKVIRSSEKGFNKEGIIIGYLEGMGAADVGAALVRFTDDVRGHNGNLCNIHDHEGNLIMERVSFPTNNYWYIVLSDLECLSSEEKIKLNSIKLPIKKEE